MPHLSAAFIQMMSTMKIYSQALKLRAGSPMGGYAGIRLSAADSDELEVNGWSFMDSISGRTIELCAIDALYAGDLNNLAPPHNGTRIFVASHTHYAPMLDSSKPQLGACAKEALDCYASAVCDSPRIEVKPDVCRIYRAEVGVPVYRRFDVPDTVFNRFLTRHGGLYPNEALEIDRGLYLFEFAKAGVTLFAMVYHACHPVSRHDPALLSPDYVGAVRKAMRERFHAAPCIFLLGCTGDVRPNYAHKRVSWLPRSRLNWRFESWAKLESQLAMDQAYSDAVHRATLCESLPLGDEALRIEQSKLTLRAQGDFNISRLVIGQRLSFEFLPFEVSHYFHLEAQKKDPMRFIVSCANHTLGYLPHSKQLPAGGYEVDGSRTCMGLNERVELKAGTAW